MRERKNWYHLALSRRTDRTTRRRAWKVVVLVEIGAGIATLVLSALSGDWILRSTNRLVAFLVIVVLLCARLVYSETGSAAKRR